MRVYDTVHGAHRILPLSVSMQGQRCRLVVGRLEHELPPYRIENRFDPCASPQQSYWKPMGRVQSHLRLAAQVN